MTLKAKFVLRHDFWKFLDGFIMIPVFRKLCDSPFFPVLLGKQLSRSSDKQCNVWREDELSRPRLASWSRPGGRDADQLLTWRLGIALKWSALLCHLWDSGTKAYPKGLCRGTVLANYAVEGLMNGMSSLRELLMASWWKHLEAAIVKIGVFSCLSPGDCRWTCFLIVQLPLHGHILTSRFPCWCQEDRSHSLKGLS